MSKKSKGRVRKFEKKSNVIAFPDRGNRSARDAGVPEGPSYDPGDYDIQSFMAEGWHNVERQDALRDPEDRYAWEQEMAAIGYHIGETRDSTEARLHDAVRTERGRAEDFEVPASMKKGRHEVHEEAPPKKKKRKKISRRARRRRRIYVAVFVLFFTIISLSAHHIVSLKMEQRELLNEQQALEDRKEELTEELKRVDDPEYIEQQAREQLHLIKPGEILYLLPEDKE